MFGITVRQISREQQIALRGARWQTGRGPDTLDVENNCGNFCVVAETGKLGHQRDARTRGRGHRPGTSPAGAHDHSNRRQLILCLNNRERRFPVAANTILLHVINELLAN